MSIKGSVLAIAAVLGSMGISTGAHSAAVTFTGTSGNLAASATFAVVGGNLQVTLANTGGDVLVPADVLTTLFFNINGVNALTPVSAVLAAGSTAVFDAQGQPSGGVVGGEWAYGSGFDAPGAATEGIGSAGFGLFGNFNFPGVDLDNPIAVNGMNYGLLSAADDLTTGNNQVTGGVPFIKSSAVFTLSGLPEGFNPVALGNISDVYFQYGTALNEPRFPGNGGGSGANGNSNPEPSSLALLGIGLLAFASVRRRRQRT